MYGVEDSDPGCIHDSGELLDYIGLMGFVPLFKNEIPGFSVEEHANPDFWWSGDESRDPWEWRMQIARSHRAAYGKFFDGKAGFISLEWLPAFANFRRDGYDFDSLCDDGLARHREKMIMDCFTAGGQLYSFEIKEKAGYGKDGLKNFEGVMTGLQSKLYLVVSDFQRKLNKRGEPYGWNIALYERPEDIWGYEAVTSGYSSDCRASRESVRERIKSLYPGAEDRKIDAVIGK